MKRLPAIRAAGITGLAASAAYVAGDVLMLGVPAVPEAHPAVRDAPGLGPTALALAAVPPRRLGAGALLGVYATPLQLAGAWHLYQGLAPAGRRAALPAAGAVAASWTVASFIHGSFLHAGDAVRALEEVGADEGRVRDRLVEHVTTVQRATVLACVPFAAASLAGSALTARAVLSGRTAFPRWSAPIVAPAPAVVAATALTASRVLPGRARHGLQGAGVSLGHLVSAAAGSALLWSGRRLRRARGGA